MTTEKSDILDIAEASQLLRVSKTTAYKMVNAGQIPHRRIGRQIRFSRQALEEFIREGQGNKGNNEPEL